MLGSSLHVATAPGSAVIRVSYKADDPQRAARILNSVIDQYLAYRREVFQDKTPAIASQRLAFEEDLNAADRAYEQFLTSNDIGDFAAAKATLAATYQTTFADRMATQSQLNQTSQRLSTLVAQQANTPAEVALQQRHPVGLDHGVDGEGRTGLALAPGAVAGMHEERLARHAIANMAAGAAALPGLIGPGFIAGHGTNQYHCSGRRWKWSIV